MEPFLLLNLAGPLDILDKSVPCYRYPCGIPAKTLSYLFGQMFFFCLDALTQGFHAIYQEMFGLMNKEMSRLMNGLIVVLMNE